MEHFISLFSLAGLLKLIQIGFIDVVLSGDNAVVIGTIVAGLAVAQQKKALAAGMALACFLRVILSLGVAWLESIPGIVIMGAIALLWVAKNMLLDLLDDGEENGSGKEPASTFGGALVAIAMADLSMSIDNVLGVAGAAGNHWAALVFGLVLSIALMGFAAGVIAKLIGRFAWIAWIGLALIVFVAGKMIYEGIPQLTAYLVAHNDWLVSHHMGFVSTRLIMAVIVGLIALAWGFSKITLGNKQVIDKTA